MNNKPAIEEIASRYTELKKAGRYLRGLCPIHQERTPSFFIKPEKQTFHCYGCGSWGDAIQLVMLIEKIDFKQACDLLKVDSKPATQTFKDQRKKELLRQFKAWCNDYHSNLCLRYRTLQKAKAQCKTEADVDRISGYYHEEPIWEHEMEMIETGTDEEKWELYREVTNGDRV